MLKPCAPGWAPELADLDCFGVHQSHISGLVHVSGEFVHSYFVVLAADQVANAAGLEKASGTL